MGSEMCIRDRSTTGTRRYMVRATFSVFYSLLFDECEEFWICLRYIHHRGLYKKRVYPGAFEAKEGNAVFGFGARCSTRAQHLENTLQCFSPTPRVSGQHTRSLFFPIFRGVARSNCSAENEGLCEYPFLQRNQEGTPCRQLEVYP